jgi:ubiquinone/menaquinone biosynthesis C-methylase UbiE
MNKQTVEKPDYGNWVSRRLIYIPALMAMLFLGLSIISSLFLIIALPFLVILLYFSYAYYEFSPSGRDIQTRIRKFVLDKIPWDGKGKALDVGCGNGALAIKLARRYPEARVTGIDYWGGKWEYSQKACERNAEIEAVAGRTTFSQASAASLPFEDESFDLAVSNFVFHEVKEEPDKRQVIREALRVLKKGGAFAFQDLFTVTRMYGEPDDLLSLIKSWGIRHVEFVNTSNAHFIPRALRLPFMVGSIGIIYGTK